MDYVEFRIDYSVLRSYAPPRVELHDGTSACFPDPGSRDVLCCLIDSSVVNAREYADGRQLEVRTNKGDLITIDGTDFPHPEFAHLVPADEQGRLMVSEMWIW